jgi:O-glycosyl hydrolase
MRDAGAPGLIVVSDLANLGREWPSRFVGRTSRVPGCYSPYMVATACRSALSPLVCIVALANLFACGSKEVDGAAGGLTTEVPTAGASGEMPPSTGPGGSSASVAPAEPQGANVASEEGVPDLALDEAPAAPDAPAAQVPEGPRPEIVPADGATLITVNPGVRHQTLEGWGTSLAWWAHQIGAWPEEPKNELLELIVNPTTGLGYNIFRYNIGGGENPAHTHMGANKDLPGFQPTPGTWDWSADARQTSVLNRLLARGESIILEAFSNSPPYWLTVSGCASGNNDGSNNLRADSYEAFADYLTEVVRHYRDDLGIGFRTLNPMNEPTAPWWYANGGQEGCHFDRTNQQQIITAVGAQLQAKGLTETSVSASDDNSMDDALANVAAYDATTLGQMAQLNAHSYNGSRRTELRALATGVGKRLWQSESGPLGVQLAGEAEAALFMAQRIIVDLRELQPQAWIDWQVIDTSRSWTSFTVNDAARTWTPTKRFYMHAGFSRYIRPGSTFVEIDSDDMVASVNPAGDALTIVARNGDVASARTFTFDLTALASVGTEVAAYRTSRTEDLVTLPALPVENWSFTTTLPPFSVTTFVVPN